MKVGGLDRELIVVELFQQMRRVVVRLPFPAIASPSATTLPAVLSLTERIHLSEPGGIERSGGAAICESVAQKKRARPWGRALQGASRSPIGEEILKAEVIIGTGRAQR